MLTQEIFYKKNGIRKLAQLLNPPIFILKELPKSASYNYIADENHSVDLSSNIGVLSNYNRVVYTDIVTDLINPEGRYTKVHSNVKALSRKFFTDNKQFKPKELPYISTDNPLLLTMANFSYINKSYKYTNSGYHEYFKWFNVRKRLWLYVNEASIYSRHQYVHYYLPKLLPSIKLLKIYESNTTLHISEVFTDQSMLNILDLWRWLVVESPLSSMAVLDEKGLSKISIIFTNESDKSIIMNLGYLRSWIKGHDLSDVKTNSNISSIQLGKFFIKALMSLQAAIDIAVNDEPLTISDVESEDEVNTSDNTGLEILDVDKDMTILNAVTSSTLSDMGVIVSNDGSVHKKKIVVGDIDVNAVMTYVNPKDILKGKILKSIRDVNIPASSAKSYLTAIDEFSRSDNPYTGTAISDFIKLSSDDLTLDTDVVKIVASDLVQDKSMLESSLLSFNTKYVTEVLDKDIMRSINDIQNAGIVIKKHEILPIEDKLGSYDMHTLTIKPIDGAQSTIKFKLPKVNDHGIMMVNGKEVVMRIQRIDLPIRKIQPNVVALTSYYGKIFITRSSRKNDSSTEWLVKRIRLLGLDESSNISKVAPADVYTNTFEAPYLYNSLAKHFKSFVSGDITFNLDHVDRSDIANTTPLAKVEANGRVIGSSTDGSIIIMDYDDNLHSYSKGVFTELGSLYDVVGVDKKKAPMDITELRVFRKHIPLGIVLAYYFGFTGLLKLLSVTYKTSAELRYRPSENEYIIKFQNITYIFSKDDVEVSLILAGFNKYKKILIGFKDDEMDNSDVYFNLLTSMKLGPIYIRELDLLKDMFIDSITLTILEARNEPTTFIGMLLYSNKLLLDFNTPDSQDLQYMRIRGYERMAGMIYSQMVQSIRSFRNRNIAGRAKVNVGNYDIWNKIVKDNSTKLIEQTNPIQNLKEVEVLTYTGEGGRSTETLNRASRAFHKSDLGVVSEATVDSSAVGVNSYLSANPNIGSLRGIMSKNKQLTNSSLFSTSMLLAPSSDKDDGKRVNFVNIQNTHTIAAEAYRQPYVRTGYEYVIGKRTSEEFSYSARLDGVVKSIDTDGIIIEYSDGKKKGIKLGPIYGAAEGTYYPHNIIPNIKEGVKFKKGDVIAYNENFFEPDILDPTEIVYKTSFPVTTAIYESNQTFEDSSAVSKMVTDSFKTTVSKPKIITLTFDQNVYDLIKVGSKVKPHDILLVIEDDITSSLGIFSSDSLSALKKIASQTPKSHYNGTIGKIEIFYNGDKAEMSDTLRKIADKYDRKISSYSKSSGGNLTNNRVTSDLNVGGKPLQPNTIAIYIYTDIVEDMGVGDKAIFANQLKSVIGEVMDYDMATESGKTINAVFGYRSISARIVNSPILIGTTITLLKIIAKRAIEVYKS